MEYRNRRLLLAKGSAAAGDPAPYMFTGDGVWYLRRHAGPGPGSAVSRWFAANIVYFRDLPSRLDRGGVSRSDPLLTAEKSKLSFVDVGQKIEYWRSELLENFTGFIKALLPQDKFMLVREQKEGSQ
ncbi:hypothetical protein BR93DRAFT_963910 [Coniochaeta sp. PMI_546]|nr:hypothetical protein BR93DRAFT_963910 [Coniochaeta sp. PMI_546]